MFIAVKSRRSLRTLLVIMIAAPVLPTIGLAPLVLVRLAASWHELGATAEVALAGIGLRMLGGVVALAAAGRLIASTRSLALAAAGRLIASTRSLARAAEALADGIAPPQSSSGVVEIDDVIRVMTGASASLRCRSEAFERAEAARRDSEARLRDFAETGSDWYWETDPDHRFTYQSDHIRDFGQDPSSRLGRARFELAADRASEPQKWRDHIAALERHEAFREFVYRRKVGAQPEHIVSVSGKPIFDSSGQFSGYRGTARDISEQVRAERSLQEAKAEAEAASLAKSQFLANMSHELRTPLNAILGFSEMLERGTAGPLDPRQQEYVGYIRQGGVHLLDVINEILDLAKIDAGKLDLVEDEGIEVRAVAEACIALVRESAAAGMLNLSIEIEAAMPLLVADSTRLKQILLNLLGNAVKLTEPGGAVVLAVRRTPGGGVEFEVRDTGLGMTPAEIGIALEPFGQVDAGIARRREGTGLGLPLAQRLTELHGGSLRIASERGRGTRMVVELPARRVLSERVAPIVAGLARAVEYRPMIAAG